MIKRNRVISGMPLVVKRSWGDALELVELCAGDILFGSGVSSDYVYFPVSCIISLGSQAGGSGFAGLALIGNEGVVGAPIFLGDISNAYCAKVRCAGKAYRLPVHFATSVATQSSQFRILILGYMQALVMDSLQTTICDAKHSSLEKISRALLLYDDRLAENKIPFDSEYIAQSIGVKTGQVIEAINQIERRGYITFDGGSLSIVNRLSLEKLTCECYGLVKQEFDRLLPVVF